jgi:uncharacterized protein YijF (DUF1287 family)
MLTSLAFALLLQQSRTVVEGARRQLTDPAWYSPSYVRIGYPGGDVPSDRGVCVDVIIRALRYVGKDLQVLIHEDMKKRFTTYPRRERKVDSNIDHRRVPNQIHFLMRFGLALPLSVEGKSRGTWQPGDLVYWKLPSGLDHCGVVSDRVGQSGLPMVIHNIRITAEEDVLSTWSITGHFRYPKTRSR